MLPGIDGRAKQNSRSTNGRRRDSLGKTPAPRRASGRGQGIADDLPREGWLRRDVSGFARTKRPKHEAVIQGINILLAVPKFLLL